DVAGGVADGDEDADLALVALRIADLEDDVLVSRLGARGGPLEEGAVRVADLVLNVFVVEVAVSRARQGEGSFPSLRPDLDHHGLLDHGEAIEEDGGDVGS